MRKSFSQIRTLSKRRAVGLKIPADGGVMLRIGDGGMVGLPGWAVHAGWWNLTVEVPRLWASSLRIMALDGKKPWKTKKTFRHTSFAGETS